MDPSLTAFKNKQTRDGRDGWCGKRDRSGMIYGKSLGAAHGPSPGLGAGVDRLVLMLGVGTAPASPLHSHEALTPCPDTRVAAPALVTHCPLYVAIFKVAEKCPGPAQRPSSWAKGTNLV